MVGESTGVAAVHTSVRRHHSAGPAQQPGRVAHDLAALLGPYGVARTADVARRADRHTVAAWVAAGRLLRPYRGVVAMPDSWDQWRTRALAGVLATRGALSHTSVLAV